jgi:hypothetical protein
MQCPDAERLILRQADNQSALVASDVDRLEHHLASCAGCRAALDEQRRVMRMLQAREPMPVSPAFAARVSARLAGESEAGILNLVNWRGWTAGLAPLAAALALAAYLGAGVTTHDSTELATTDSTTTEATIETWTTSAAAGTSASVFLESGASADALLETVLTGVAPVVSGDPNVR